MIITSYNEKELKEVALSRRDIYEGRIFSVHSDTVSLPNGSESSRDIVEHHGGVCVAAFNDKGEIALVRQYRYAYGEVITEVPAGKLEKGENPDDAIRRELAEEVGAEGKNWQSMGIFYPTPGYVTEKIHLYTCEISSIGAQHLDDDEFLSVSFVPLSEAVELVLSGKIADGKTQTLILKCALLRGIGKLHGGKYGFFK